MTWQQVVSLVVLVGGAVGAAFAHEREMAFTLAGAAAGFITPRQVPGAPVILALAAGGAAAVLS